MKGLAIIPIMLIGIIFISIITITIAQTKETKTIYTGKLLDNLILNPSFSELRYSGEEIILNGGFENNFTDWFSFYGNLPNDNVSLENGFANITYFDDFYEFERLSQNLSELLTNDKIYNLTFYYKSFNLTGEAYGSPFTNALIGFYPTGNEFEINDTDVISAYLGVYDFIDINKIDVGNNITKINILFSLNSEAVDSETFGIWSISSESVVNKTSWFAIDNISLNIITLPKDWYYVNDISNYQELNLTGGDLGIWNLSHFNLTDNKLFSNLNEHQNYCDLGYISAIKSHNLTLENGKYNFKFDIKGIINTTGEDEFIIILPNENEESLANNIACLSNDFEVCLENAQLTDMGDNTYRFSYDYDVAETNTYQIFIYGLASCEIIGDSYVYLDNFALQEYETKTIIKIKQNPELIASMIGLSAMIIIGVFVLANFIKFK